MFRLRADPFFKQLHINKQPVGFIFRNNAHYRRVFERRIRLVESTQREPKLPGIHQLGLEPIFNRSSSGLDRVAQRNCQVVPSGHRAIDPNCLGHYRPFLQEFGAPHHFSCAPH